MALNQHDLAREALKLFASRRDDAGVQRYREALERPNGYLLPVGLHTAMLDASGQRVAAESIRRAGLHVGADLSLAAWMPLGDYAKASAEYRRLFAEGIGTAYMVERYLLCLSKIGDADGLSQIVAPDLLFRQTSLPLPCPGFMEDVATALKQAPVRKFHERRDENAAWWLHRVKNTHLLKDPAVVELHALVADQVAVYVRDVKAAGHAIARWLPTQFDLVSWALLTEDGIGYVQPHTHGGAWIVAVVYVEGTHSLVGEGAMHVGPNPNGDKRCAGWPDFVVQPVPGTLVIMPGFYTHWTTPMSSPAPRLSVAINVVPRLPADDPDAPLRDTGGSR